MRFFLDWAPFPPGLIEVGSIEVSVCSGASNSPPTASAVETAAAKNEHEDDDDQKRSAIHGSLLAETNSAMIDAQGLAIEATTRLSIHGGQFQPLWITFACSHSQHDLKGHCWALTSTVDAI